MRNWIVIDGVGERVGFVVADSAAEAIAKTARKNRHPRGSRAFDRGPVCIRVTEGEG
mgnify:CR=1 FL=1